MAEKSLFFKTAQFVTHDLTFYCSLKPSQLIGSVFEILGIYKSKAISNSREKIGTSDFVAWGISNLIHPSLQMDLTWNAAAMPRRAEASVASGRRAIDIYAAKRRRRLPPLLLADARVFCALALLMVRVHHFLFQNLPKFLKFFHEFPWVWVSWNLSFLEFEFPGVWVSWWVCSIWTLHHRYLCCQTPPAAAAVIACWCPGFLRVGFTDG